MFAVFKRFRNRFRAIKAADQIVDEIGRLLMPGFVHFRASGVFDKKMQGDEFLLSYLYGVFAYAIEARGIRDDMQKGSTLWECFDRFFPGEGKQILSSCTLRLEGRSEGFNRGVAKGWKETKEAYESGGQRRLPSLVEHLVHHYGRT